MIALAIIGCDRSGSAPVASAGSTAHPRFEVLAAENFWGSIAAQLAGSRALVQSVIVNPSTDPHSYQPTAADARAIAGANMVIVNGLGYDNWASQLLQASPLDGRVVLDVGGLLGLSGGANPHRWYFPADVRKVIDRVVADYDRIDPADAGYFTMRQRHLEDVELARYDRLRAEIRTKYAGVPVGYSESIFQGLGEDLDLKLMTPYSFAKAISEGADVTAGDREVVEAQAQSHRIKVWIFNAQNVSPDVRRVNRIMMQQRIPTVTITETLTPASATFEQWQVGELERLLKALREGTGR